MTHWTDLQWTKFAIAVLTFGWAGSVIFLYNCILTLAERIRRKP